MTALHPTAAEVEKFVLGAFEEIEFRDIRGHFSSCDTCARELQRQAAIDIALEEVAFELDSSHKTAGGYAIESELSRSPNGRTYVARDASGRRIALKELALREASDLDAIKHFERETRLLEQLDHPAIPRFVAAFTEERRDGVRLYLGHELIEGESLAAIIARGRTTEREARQIALQVLDVLSYLHTLSPPIYHRDIHPENIVRRADGSIVLVNFGAARDCASTTSVSIVGKFGFVPMEQLAGVVDQTSDLFALGATLIHLLTLREPWTKDPKSLLEYAQISPKFKAFLEKLTASRVGDRFQSSGDALRVLSTMERPATRARNDQPDQPWRLFTRILVIAGLGAVLFLTFMTVTMMHKGPQTLQPPQSHITLPLKSRLHPCLASALGDKTSIGCQHNEFVALQKNRRARAFGVYHDVFGAQRDDAIRLPDHITQAIAVGPRIFVVSPPSEVGIFNVDPMTGVLDPNAKWFDVPEERDGISAIGGIAWDRDRRVYVATRGAHPSLYLWEEGSDAWEKVGALEGLEVRGLSISISGDSLYAISGQRLYDLRFDGGVIGWKGIDVKPLEDVDMVWFGGKLALIGAFISPQSGPSHAHTRECIFLDVDDALLRRIMPCGPEGEAVFDQLPKMSREEEGTAVLRLVSRPPAELYIDGVLAGTTPVTKEVSAGVHRITLRARGYEPYLQSVHLQAGLPHMMSIELAREHVPDLR